MLPQTQKLNVQCFVKECLSSSFLSEKDLKLLYVGKTSPVASAYPRIMHAHPDFLEIVLIVSGTGEYFIHDKLCTVQAGDLLIYNAGIVHDEFAGTNVQIGSYCMAVSGLHLSGLRENALIPDSYGQVFHCGDEFEDISMMFEMMYRNLSQPRLRAAVICDSLMRTVLEKVFAVTEHANHIETTLPPQVYALGIEIKTYIDEHFGEPVTLQSISEALSISSYYLSHIFKRMSGYSPFQYLIRRRIGEAQTLLIMTNLPIIRIVEMVGYETQSYFNFHFTKYIGMPPKRFRRNFVVESAEQKPIETKQKICI